MKKSILFAFTLIPLLMSCNNNNRGFVNPFPEDDYHPIGFNIATDERVTRPLLSDEEDLVDKTVDHLADFNPLITKVHAVIQERNYERAFAGVFEQGYSVSNKLYKDEYNTIRYSENKETEPKYLCRQEKDSTSTTIADYSYGRNTFDSNTKTVHYLAFLNGEEYGEAESDENATCTVEQVLEKVETGTYDHVSATKLTPKPQSNEPVPWYDADMEIKQDDYICKINEATSTPGANKEDKVILIKEEHTPYGDDESGIYSLPDGRQYQAMINSITVMRLAKQPPKTINDEAVEWYLVEYARYYEETAITSNLIQPNVPISYLTKPIVIEYKEHKYYFSADMITDFSTFNIPPVEIKDEE